MDVFVERGVGLDVHVASVVADALCGAAGGRPAEESRTFGTTTGELEAMAQWIVSLGVTHVAMESTGIYWRPIWNVLEGRGLTLLLVNAHHVKKVPGRKTDTTDAAWLARLLRAGLLRSSLVPGRERKELRELTRHRTQLTHERARVANRIQKVLEDANLKLSCVASDVLGVSGRDMIRAIINGEENPAVLAEMARGKMKRKRDRLREALRGRITEHHRYMLADLMGQVERLEPQITAVAARIEARTVVHAATIQRLDAVPGIDRKTAEVLIAEIGTDMSVFPSADDLCSWAAICPGNHESAGKRGSGRTRRGNRWLKGALLQAAWAAGHAKGTYPHALMRRLKARRGEKRAAVGVAHALLRAVYAMLRDGVEYKDLGADHFDKLRGDGLTNSLVKRLERLGHVVTLRPATQA